MSQEIARQTKSDPLDLLKRLHTKLDGAYNIVFLNALGEMFVSRDPLGVRPPVLGGRRRALRSCQRERGPGQSGF